MVPSADERYSSDGGATTTMMKRKSGSKEDAKTRNTPALDRLARKVLTAKSF